MKPSFVNKIDGGNIYANEFFITGGFSDGSGGRRTPK